MATGEKLKSLGGGRWQSQDGRYTVEQESGTWVVVDDEQTNELGLPLVRGPYPTLTAAREAIEGFRETGAAKSPLADRIAEGPKDGEHTKQTAEHAKPPKPEPPREPRWLRDLDEVSRRRFRALVRKLEAAGIEDAEDVARQEVADNTPALAQRALERKLGEAKTVRQAVEVILDGSDRELGAHWRLVDDNDRDIRRLDLDRQG
jgi:hypothetical protein